MLAQLRIALDLLAADGVLIAKIGDTFTRFTASLLYVVALLFAEVQIVKPPTLPPWTCDRVVVARGYLGLPAALATHLAAVHAQLDAAVDLGPGVGELDVLTFVPAPRLLAPSFFRFLCRTTERYAQRETHAVSLLAGELATRVAPSAAAVAEAQGAALALLPLLAD